jgi:hypothetical protein
MGALTQQVHSRESRVQEPPARRYAGTPGCVALLAAVTLDNLAAGGADAQRASRDAEKRAGWTLLFDGNPRPEVG